MTGKGRLNYFIDCGLIITFLLAFITGVIKVPELTWLFRGCFSDCSYVHALENP